MPENLFEFGWQPELPKDDKIYGVTIATVINNLDLLGQARVQVSLPWAPGIQPWARIATMMAGLARGTYFIPQVGEEVLVAFNQGDIREPFVIGALWNTLDRPPALLPTDAISKRIIRTPLGQEITFDDLLQSVTITNTTQQTLTLGPVSAELAAGTLPPPAKASVSLDLTGAVTITGLTSITLKAPKITLDGGIVQINGATSTTLSGGANCTISGLQVNIG